MENSQKIRSFTDLIAWKEAHKLVIFVYKITKQFPKEELYALGDQMRRCAVSISSNIAEGFSRKTNKEKAQFYSMARGSITELKNQLMVARDVEYITKEKFKEAACLSVLVHKLVNGLMKKVFSI